MDRVRRGEVGCTCACERQALPAPGRTTALGLIYSGVGSPMSRLLLLVFVLAEVNFRCVSSSACEDDDDRCVERHDETETETAGDGDGDGDGEDDDGPQPDLGG